jgi:hypothetical protein
MNINFRNLIDECISECIDELKLESSDNSSLSGIEIKSLNDFYADEIKAELDENEEATTTSGIDNIDTDKYRNMLGSQFKELSDEELISYLNAFQRQIKIDRYKYPYIHPSTAVKITDKDGKKYDLEKLKSTITQRPSKILKQNEKIQKSGGKSYVYYNIGLPALKGLAVNEKTGKIVVVDTCPGAGQCKVYCYAKKGGYVQYENAPIASTRLLNFLINDPSGFSNMLTNELSAAQEKANKEGASVVVRWHDSGDMFSSDYTNLAYDIAKKFPDIKFYAYTKLASVSGGDKPDNFLMNFSAGAKKPEERQVDLSKDKHSTVVPKQMFDDLIVKDEKGKAVRVDKKIQFKPEDMKRFKKKLSLKYNVPVDSILTYEEMKDTPESDEVGKYNVIVRPGDGDESANRKDVRGTYLLIH